MSLNYSQLPSWLEKNSVFRVLFIIRKLYLTKTKFSHYSQFAEDISIVRIFDKNYRGFFVDVGCFHPKKYSNTWLLYKKGWRGINIDIDSIKIDGFNIARPKDTNIASAVSNIEGEINYYSNGFYSLTISLDEGFVESRAGYIKKTTQCTKLSRLIDQTKYKDKQIDFLSVDAEAHDLEVLMSLDFKRYNPKLIAVETHYALFTEVEKSPLYSFLISKDYCMVGWCGLTLLMANKSLQQKLSS
jgi:Methyltransferase FkbM domain